MLIRFNIRNFLSFSSKADGSTEEFSMIAGKVRSKKEHIYDNGDLKLLKFAAIYGANASGKSNLVKAMKFFRQVVVNGLPDGHTEKYCKVVKNNKDMPSYFEVEMMLGKKYYAYGFEVLLNQSKFIEEWLVELYPNNTEKILFHRDIENGTYESGGELSKSELRQNLDVYAGDIRDDSSALFLSIMNQNKKRLYQSYDSASVLKNVFLWLRNDFDVNYPNQPILDYNYFSKTDRIDEICKILSAFGTGITGFQMVDVPIESVFRRIPKALQERILSDIEKGQVKMRSGEKNHSIDMVIRGLKDFFVITLDGTDDIKCQTIEFSHGLENVFFGIDEESDGTVRILDLLEILISGEGKTYVIDELDRCLHPSLTYQFVHTFFNIARQRNIQLIVTTHESRLMDFELLRRDEIWFVNKRNTGESDIYSLEEYNERFDKKIDKAYLEGRYGGVPIFTTIFPLEGD